MSRRIGQLQAAAALRTVTTVERLTDELDQARALAFEHGQAHAGVSATIAKAKLHGLWVSRKETTPAPAQSIDEIVASMIDTLGAEHALEAVEQMRTLIVRRMQVDASSQARLDETA